MFISKRIWLILIFSLLLGVSLWPIDGCELEWTPWTPCDPGPCGQLRGIQDRMRTVVKAPLLNNQANDRCDVSLSGDPASQLALIEERKCSPSQPCYPVTYCTSPELFLCNNSICVSKTLLCNSDNDCVDRSDEEFCPAPAESCVFRGEKKFPVDDLWSRGRNAINGDHREKVLSDRFHGSCVSANNNNSRLVYNIENPTFSEEVLDDQIEVHKFNMLADCLRGVVFTSSQCLSFFKGKDKNNFPVFVTRKVITINSFTIKEHDVILDSKFERSLANLPEVMSYKLYTEFIAKYGTHYPTHVKLGGEMILVSITTEEADDAMTTVLKGLWSRFAHSLTESDLKTLEDYHDKVAVYFLGGLPSPSLENGQEFSLANFRGRLSELSQWQKYLFGQPTIIEDESKYLPLNRLVQNKTISNNLLHVIESFLKTYEEDDSLCSCETGYTPAILKDSGRNVVSQYGCLCVPIMLKEMAPEADTGGGNSNAGGIAVLLILFLLLLTAFVLLALYRYHNLRKTHPTMMTSPIQRQIMAVFCYKGVAKPKRKKNTPSQIITSNEEPYSSVLYVRESPQWFNPNDQHEGQHMLTDATVEEEEDEEEEEEEEDEAPPPVPVIKTQDFTAQADIPLPSSDETTCTESFVDFVGVHDVEGIDLTILPDRRVVVSTQDNKVVIVTVKLTESSHEVTNPPWKKPRGVAYHFRKDAKVMSSLLVADSSYITHWKPTDETFWTVRLKQMGKTKSEALDKYELLDVDVLSEDKLIILAEKFSVKEYRVLITNRDGDVSHKWELDKKGTYCQIKVAEGSKAVFISDVTHGSIGVYVPEDGRLLTSFKVTDQTLTSPTKDAMKSFSREITKRASFRGSFRRKKKDEPPTSPTNEADKTPKKDSTRDYRRESKGEPPAKEENAREMHPFGFCCLAGGDLLIGGELGVHVWTSYGTCNGQLLRTDERVLALHIYEDLLAILTVSQLRLYSVFGVPLPVQSPAVRSPLRRLPPQKIPESLLPDDQVSWV